MASPIGSDSSLRFVPEMLVDYINKRNKNDLEPASFFIHGVCLLVDISGFTKLSGDYCDQGKSGIDDLQLATNGFMGRLVEIIYSFGGDIIKFAGDAIICVFSADFITNVSAKKLRRSTCGFESFKINLDDLESSSFEPASSESVKLSNVSVEVILRVMHCARVLREVQTDKLTVHVAMSCGEMCFGILGGFENRWECLISGPCIHQLSGCLDDAPSKHAVISPQCVKILKDATAATAVPFADQNNKGKLKLFTSVINTNAGMYVFEILPLKSGNYRIVDVQCASTIDALATAINKASAKIKSNAQSHLNLIHQFVPVPIADELESAAGLNLMAEIREVTTMFMKWDSYDANVDHRNLLTLQPCFIQAQRILQSTGAYLRQFLVDDKGCVLIACWGMPHLSYLDNAYRALSASVQIRAEMYKLEMNCSFGITTGDVYCGTVGSALRMEYAAIGSVVNMSARLMGKAAGSILVDESTYSRLKLSARAILSPIEPFLVKGRAEPLQTFRYSGTGSLTQPEQAVEDHEISIECRQYLTVLLQRMGGTASTRRDTRMSVKLSNTSDRRSWFAWINRTTSAVSSTLPLLVIQGKDGSGRSTVCTWLKSQAAEYAIPVAAVRLSRKDTQYDYIVWRKLFVHLMPRDLFSSTSVQRNYVHNLLRKVYSNSPKLARTQGYPVLRSVLGITCDFDATPSTINNPNTSARNSTRNNTPGDSMRLSGSVRALWSFKMKPTGSHKPHTIQVLDTLVRIFTYLLSALPTLLIIENVQQADEDSLKLLHEMSKIHSRSAIVCTALMEASTTTTELLSRKDNTNTFNNSKEYKANAFNSTPWSKHHKDVILTHKTTISITLANYTPEEIDKMLSVALNLKSVPPEISQVVQDFSGGSLFWVREILQFIKEHGPELFMSAIGENEKENDKPPPRPTSALLARAPSSRMLTRAPSFKQPSMRKLNVAPHQQQLDKLVLTRFGNMSSENQRVLRTASIIGMTFSAEVLHGVLPVHLKARQDECLLTLLNQKWIYQDQEILHIYQFAHPHSHQIIYELTPSSERNNLHQLIADQLESQSSQDKSQYAPLSYHYRHCDTDKALQYAVKATNYMLHTENIYDFGDCLDLLMGLLDCCKTPFDVEVLQRLVNKAKVTIEEFDVTPETAATTHYLYFLHYLSVHCSCRGSGNTQVVAPAPLNKTRSGLSSGGDSKYNFDLSDERDEDEIREINHETEGGDINYEARTKRLLLLQINKFRNQLSTKYVDLSEEGNITSTNTSHSPGKSTTPTAPNKLSIDTGESGVKAMIDNCSPVGSKSVPKEWQKSFLSKPFGSKAALV